jgi:6-phosphogluconolactonase (cycloisomerase 2 family)
VLLYTYDLTSLLLLLLLPPPPFSFLPQLFVISTYSRFDNLAHGPFGTESKFGLYTYGFNSSNGTMTLLSVGGSDVVNPAFSRMHRDRNIIYCCTEDIEENGRVLGFKIEQDGKLTKVRGGGEGKQVKAI